MNEEILRKPTGAHVRLTTFVLLVILVAVAFGGAGYLYGINAGKTLISVTKTSTATATVSATTSKTVRATTTATTITTAIPTIVPSTSAAVGLTSTASVTVN